MIRTGQVDGVLKSDAVAQMDFVHDVFQIFAQETRRLSQIVCHLMLLQPGPYCVGPGCFIQCDGYLSLMMSSSWS